MLHLLTGLHHNLFVERLHSHAQILLSSGSGYLNTHRIFKHHNPIGLSPNERSP